MNPQGTPSPFGGNMSPHMTPNDYKEKYILGLEARLGLMRDIQDRNARISELEAKLLKKDLEIEKLKNLLESRSTPVGDSSTASPSFQSRSVQADRTFVTPSVPNGHAASKGIIEDAVTWTAKKNASSSSKALQLSTPGSASVERPRSRNFIVESDDEEHVTSAKKTTTPKKGRGKGKSGVEQNEETVDPDEKVKQIEAKYGELVGWREVLRHSQRGSITHMRQHHRDLIRGVFEDFLIQRLGQDAHYCVLAAKPSEPLEVALPSELYDDFQDYLDEQIDKGLFDRPKSTTKRPSFGENRSGTKRKQPETDDEKNDHDGEEWGSWVDLLRTKYPTFKFAVWGNHFSTKYFENRTITFKIIDQKRHYPLKYAKEFVAAFEEKFADNPGFLSFLEEHGTESHPPPKKIKASDDDMESDNADDNEGHENPDRNIEFGPWKDLVGWVLNGRFKDLKSATIQDMEQVTQQFLRDNVNRHGFGINECHMASLDNPEKLDWWVPKPLWDDYLHHLQGKYDFMKKTARPITMEDTHVADNGEVVPDSNPQDENAAEPEADQATQPSTPRSNARLPLSPSHRQSAPVPPTDLAETANAHPLRKSLGMSPNREAATVNQSDIAAAPSAQAVLTLPRLGLGNPAVGTHEAPLFPERVGYATVMRRLYPTYNELPKQGRVEIKRKVREYLTRIRGDDINNFVVHQLRDGKPHHTYVIESPLQQQFMDWAKAELNATFNLDL